MRYTWAKIILIWESSFFNCLEISFANMTLASVSSLCLTWYISIGLFTYFLSVSLQLKTSSMRSRSLSLFFTSPSSAPPMVFDSWWVKRKQSYPLLMGKGKREKKLDLKQFFMNRSNLQKWTWSLKWFFFLKLCFWENHSCQLRWWFNCPVTNAVQLYGLAKLSFLKCCWISKEAVIFLIDLMPVPLLWKIPCAAQWNMDDKNWTSGSDLSKSLMFLSSQVMLNCFYFQSAVLSVFPFKFSRVIIPPGGMHICFLWSVK